MSSMFAPYSGRKPKTVVINGNRVLIISPDREAIEERLVEFGGDKVKEISMGDTQHEAEFTLMSLALKAKAPVIITPSEIELDDVLKNLETQLPWVH